MNLAAAAAACMPHMGMSASSNNLTSRHHSYFECHSHRLPGIIHTLAWVHLSYVPTTCNHTGHLAKFSSPTRLCNQAVQPFLLACSP